MQESLSSYPILGNNFQYRADIDGLRAIAVISVLFYHANLGAPGGFVGVDVFFVISGFLITGLIRKEADSGTFSISRFWERRIRRILPALIVVLLTVLLAGWFTLATDDFRELGQSALAQALLIPNLYFYLDSDYFATAAQMRPLLHTWSLAVEEQFYILFPLMLAVLVSRAKSAVVPVLAGITTISFAASIYASVYHPLFNFYLLPTRAWELLLGSLLAVMQVRVPKRIAEFVSAAGLVSILMSVTLYDHDTRFPGVAALLPCLGAAALIASSTASRTRVAALLSLRPIVFIGLISYSLYLWHWPLFVFARFWSFGTIQPSVRVSLLLLSVALATVTWKFVETPFRKAAVLRSRPQVFAFAGVCTLSILLIGSMLHLGQGIPSRIPASARAYLGENISENYETLSVTVDQARQGEFYPLGTQITRKPVTVLLWGDSHAMTILPTIDSLLNSRQLIGYAAVYRATVPVLGYQSTDPVSLGQESIPWNQAVIDFVRKNDVQNVVMVARWDRYMNSDEDVRDLAAGLRETATALSDAGTHLWILRQVPLHTSNAASAVVLAAWYGRDPDQLGTPVSENRELAERQDQLFASLVEFPHVTILDPAPLFLNDLGLYGVSRNGRALYVDANHLTRAGAEVLLPLLTPALVESVVTSSSRHRTGGFVND